MIGVILLVAAATRCQPDSAMAQAAHEAYASARRAAPDDETPAFHELEWVGAVDTEANIHLALASRDGMTSGLVLVRCDAQVIGVRTSGRIDTVRIVHLTGRPYGELAVLYRSGYGTGYLRHSLAILGTTGDSLPVLLDLVTEERSNDPLADGGREDSTTVTMATDGEVVRTGRRFTLRCPADGDCRRTHPIPIAERYRWDPTRRQFIRSRRR